MKNDFLKLPLKLNQPRVWRTYLGGRELDRLHGAQPPYADGHFPEEWVASVISARNAGREHIQNEGLALLADQPELSLKEVLENDPFGMLGEAQVQRYGAHPGILFKLIDAAERLTIQVHPDRETAKRLFNSPFGKTECWQILSTRTDCSEPACVYVGFKEGVTREKWKDLFDRQDVPGMLACLHRFTVQSGDTILLEGGVPHAIGAGCFLAEIQEPTDYTIRVERTTPSGFPVADSMCHQGLGFQKMFDCFHYDGLSQQDARSRWFLQPQSALQTDGGTVTQLTTAAAASFFSMRQITVNGRLEMPAEPFSILYVLEGKGKIRCEAGSVNLESPSQFFLPASMTAYTLESEQPLRLMQCFGPK